MKRKEPLAFLLFLSILFFSCNQDHNPAEFSSNKKQNLDSFFYSIQQALPLPAVALTAIKDDHVYTNAQGKIQSDREAAITNNTLFFTGNISELMVATAILKLVDNEKIQLDDPVVKHLPYFKLKGDYKAITIRHLLTHSSGIPVLGVAWDSPDLTEKSFRKYYTKCLFRTR